MEDDVPIDSKNERVAFDVVEDEIGEEKSVSTGGEPILPTRWMMSEHQASTP